MEGIFTEKRKKVILFLISVLAVFLTVFHYIDTPMPWVDEGVYTETAKNLAMHGVLGMQIEPGQYFSMRNFLLSASYPVIVPVALSFKIFGTGIWQARLPMILYILAFALLYYLYTEKRYGFKNAILSTLLLLSFSPFYGNGRPVQGEVPGLVFLVLGALLVFLWERDEFKNARWALFSGLAFGLASSTKPIFLVLLPVAIIFSLLIWIKKFANKRELFIFLAGMVFPIIIWCFVHIPSLDLFRQFVSKSIYLAGSGKSLSIWQTIINNLSKFFTETTPILFLFLSATIIFALCLRLFKKEYQFSLSEIIIVSFIILNWLTYLPGTGWYRYFFPANALLYLFFPPAIVYIAEFFQKNTLKKTIIIIPILLIMFQFVHLLFYSDTRFNMTQTRSSELKAVLSGIRPYQSVFFYRASEAIIFLNGDNYSQYFAMNDFFKFGDENGLKNTKADFILARGNDYNLSCYRMVKPVSRYDFLERIKDCKK